MSTKTKKTIEITACPVCGEKDNREIIAVESSGFSEQVQKHVVICDTCGNVTPVGVSEDFRSFISATIEYLEW